MTVENAIYSEVHAAAPDCQYQNASERDSQTTKTVVALLVLGPGLAVLSDTAVAVPSAV